MSGVKVIKNILVALTLLLSCSVQAKDGLETSGDVLHLLLPAAALGTTIWYEEGDSGSWQLIKSAVASRVATEALKLAVHRTRPDHSGNDSFPSGHSADTFMAATFINQRYGWQYGLPAYAVASYVGYTRIASDRHHVTDVLAGAALGSLAAWYFTTPYSNKVTITPVVGHNQYGLLVSGRF